MATPSYTRENGIGGVAMLSGLVHTLDIAPRDAAELLTEAHQNECWVRNLLPDLRHTPALRHHFQELCRQAWHEGQTFAGQRENQSLLSVGLFAMPTDNLRLQSAWSWLASLYRLVTTQRLTEPTQAAYLDEYLRFVQESRPSMPHARIEALGVHPSRRRHGLARQLLQTIHRITDAEPTCTGVLLHTDNPAALALYLQSGYRVTATTTLGGLDLHTLFRTARSDSFSTSNGN